MESVDTTERLAALRALMRQPERNIQAYVVPSEDAHSSEYIADCDARREYITGFTGSAGVAIIPIVGKAQLFTDGRYHLQASRQLSTSWNLQKVGLKDVPTWQDYLEKHLDSGSRIGIDPTVLSASEANSLIKRLEPTKSTLVPVMENLVDIVRGEARPERPATQVKPLDVKYSGKSTENKLKELRSRLTELKASAIVVSMLDEIAWLFNLRANDIDYNPVLFAYAIVTMDKATLFMNDAQIGPEVRQHLGSLVEIQPYDAIFSHVESLRDSLTGMDNKKVVAAKQASWKLVETLGQDNVLITVSPIAEAKAIKNEVETEGFRQSHIRDGAALVRYFAWLEEQLAQGVELNEYDAALKLEEYRSKLDLFMGLSFPTISSTGPNGAIIHYGPLAKGSAIIQRDEMYLCDSGAQFQDGTTDTTRTWHFGTPSEKEVRAFTRVVQGHISIDTAVFPGGTTGYIIDSFARRALWQDGLDYRHGTGHGVGHFLNVHEGPQGIGTRIAYNDTSLKPGMVLSNEPGYYEDGKFGIRIENVCIVKKAETPYCFDERGYFGFEHFTMCPIHTKLIDKSLLTKPELEWINAYHAEVLEKVKPLLAPGGKYEDARALSWLERECAAI
ncbi:Creatinase/aminopeptidase [Clavulina sp. PMI_390]|nr:Creatinase/aminopeptidase [Clavulina sp. PMI_390]